MRQLTIRGSAKKTTEKVSCLHNGKTRLVKTEWKSTQKNQDKMKDIGRLITLYYLPWQTH